MLNFIGIDPMGNKVYLSARAENHIMSRHPEMRSNLRYVKATIIEPEYLLWFEKRRSYAALKRLKEEEKLTLVIIYDKEGNIRTAYKTSKPQKLMKKGDVVYTAKNTEGN